MDNKRPSSTAIGAAMLRAAHLLLDEEPYVLRDPLALPLTGIQGDDALRAAIDRLHRDFSQHCDPEFARVIVQDLRSTVLMRNRYAEDRLEAAMAGGIRQYVMLGSGLDSFAHRRADLVGKLDVYEV